MKMNLNLKLETCRPLLVFAVGLYCCLGRAQIQMPGSEGVDIRRDATVVAVEKVMPSVVNIATKNILPVRDPFEEFYRQFYGRKSDDTPYSLGSGVVIDEAGYLLTNDHVIRRADKIAVKFATGTEVYDATIVASDPKSDIALLKLNGRPGEKFHAIKLATEDDVLLGETVMALGNPFGLGGSVTRGILSSKTRRVAREGEPLVIQDCLQTDAAINPGSSGGPLVNLRGELIGINDQYVPEAQSIGFAIPIKKILSALTDLFPGEFVKSFWFGARVKAGSTPPVIASVQPDSPAGRAGLKAGDAVLSLNGKAPHSFIDFADLLIANAGASEKLTVQRGLDRLDLSLRLVPEKDVFNTDMVRNKLGLSLERGAKGFIITEVQSNSPASAAGLQNGMLVKQIKLVKPGNETAPAVDADEPPPADVTALAKLIHRSKKDELVRLDVAAWQQNGAFNILREGSVELSPR